MIDCLIKNSERMKRYQKTRRKTIKKTTLGQHTLISVEGYDNAGKTTFIKALKSKLWMITRRTNSHPSIHIVSPSDTKSGKVIKTHYKNKDKIGENNELELHAASIDELGCQIRQIIKEHNRFDQSSIFIIDRFIDSTLAYQPDEDIIGKEDNELWQLYEYYAGKLDHTIYLDLDERLYLERVKSLEGQKIEHPHHHKGSSDLPEPKIEHPKERDIEHYKRVTSAYWKLRQYDSIFWYGHRVLHSADSRDLMNNFDKEVKLIAENICFDHSE